MAALTLVGALLLGGCADSPRFVPAVPVAGEAGAAMTSTDLRNGLLGSEDGVVGLAPVTGHADEDGARALFEGSGCEELTRLLNAQKLPGSRAEAAVALSVGPEGAAAAEQLYAMASPAAAGQVVERYRRSVLGCPEITLTVAGAGASAFPVRPVPLVEVGDASFATAVRSAGDQSLGGQDIVQVVAQSGALVIAVTLMGTSPGEAEQLARAAVHKVRHELADRHVLPAHHEPR